MDTGPGRGVAAYLREADRSGRDRIAATDQAADAARDAAEAADELAAGLGGPSYAASSARAAERLAGAFRRLTDAFAKLGDAARDAHVAVAAAQTRHLNRVYLDDVLGGPATGWNRRLVDGRIAEDDVVSRAGYDYPRDCDDPPDPDAGYESRGHDDPFDGADPSVVVEGPPTFDDRGRALTDGWGRLVDDPHFGRPAYDYPRNVCSPDAASRHNTVAPAGNEPPDQPGAGTHDPVIIGYGDGTFAARTDIECDDT